MPSLSLNTYSYTISALSLSSRSETVCSYRQLSLALSMSTLSRRFWGREGLLFGSHREIWLVQAVDWTDLDQVMAQSCQDWLPAHQGRDSYSLSSGFLTDCFWRQGQDWGQSSCSRSKPSETQKGILQPWSQTQFQTSCTYPATLSCLPLVQPSFPNRFLKEAWAVKLQSQRRSSKLSWLASRNFGISQLT